MERSAAAAGTGEGPPPPPTSPGETGDQINPEDVPPTEEDLAQLREWVRDPMHPLNRLGRIKRADWERRGWIDGAMRLLPKAAHDAAPGLTAKIPPGPPDQGTVPDERQPSPSRD